MRVFFKTGDNNHFSKVAQLTKQFIKDNPPPKFRAENGKEYPLQVRWSGLLKVNNDWQDIMVTGMMISFLESFGIVVDCKIDC
jgi:hypothetical protein